MGKTIKVRAITREGISFTFTPGRGWPCGQTTDVEVIDQDDDPPPVIEESIGGDPTTGSAKLVTRVVHKLEKIGRKTYAELKENPFISILSDDETSREMSTASLDAARRSAAEVSGKLVESEGKVAELTEQLAKAKERISSLESDLALALSGPPEEKHGKKSKG